MSNTNTQTEAVPEVQGLEVEGAAEFLFPKLLSLEIPETRASSSVESSSPSSSPGGIINSSTTTTASTSTAMTTSSHSSLLFAVRPGLSVKFAPLPELEPRKRRSSVPLGMAARGQLVRRRRTYQDPDSGPQYTTGNSPMWTEEELGQARMRQVAAAVRERQRREAAEKNEAGDPNDPFLVLGRKMKDASKQIWKRVSKKDMKKEKENAASPSSSSSSPTENAKERKGTQQTRLNIGSYSQVRSPRSSDFPEVFPQGEEEVEEKVRKSENRSDSSTDCSTTPTSSQSPTPIECTSPLRSILVSSQPEPEPCIDVEEEGGVWEEEIDPHFPLHTSQIEGSLDILTPSQSKRLSLWAEDDLAQVEEPNGFAVTELFNDNSFAPIGAENFDVCTIQSESS